MIQDNRDRVLKIITEHYDGITMNKLVVKSDISENTIRKITKDLETEKKIIVVRRKRPTRFHSMDKKLEKKFTDVLEKMRTNIEKIQKEFFSSEYDLQKDLTRMLEEVNMTIDNRHVRSLRIIDSLYNEYDTKDFDELCEKIMDLFLLKQKNIKANKLGNLINNCSSFSSKVADARNFIQSAINDKITYKKREPLRECVKELESELSRLEISLYDIHKILEDEPVNPDILDDDYSYLLPSIEKKVNDFNKITSTLSDRISNHYQKTKTQKSIANTEIQKSIANTEIQKCIEKISAMDKYSKEIEKHLSDAHKSTFFTEQEQKLDIQIIKTENIFNEMQKSYDQIINKAEKYWPKPSMDSFRKHCKT